MTEIRGRRERKRAAIRKALADTALALFLERGYDRVSVKEIADAVDVSTTTLFKYFPTKESLVFDLDQEREEELVSVVRDRPEGMSMLAALRQEFLTMVLAARDDLLMRVRDALIQRTPVLSAYAERMWLRHAGALAVAMATELGLANDDPACVALARFVLDVPLLASGYPEPETTIARIFELLEVGWEAIQTRPQSSTPRS